MTITTDQHKLSQVIYNLLTNAYKFTDKNGSVNLSYKVIDDQVIITVTDTGRGIEVSQMPYIFDAYFQLDETYEGEGIGLYVAQENMHQLGGTISVDSTVGMGTKFTLRLPLTNQAVK